MKLNKEKFGKKFLSNKNKIDIEKKNIEILTIFLQYLVLLIVEIMVAFIIYYLLILEILLRCYTFTNNVIIRILLYSLFCCEHIFFFLDVIRIAANVFSRFCSCMFGYYEKRKIDAVKNVLTNFKKVEEIERLDESLINIDPEEICYIYELRKKDKINHSDKLDNKESGIFLSFISKYAMPSSIVDLNLNYLYKHSVRYSVLIVTFYSIFINLISNFYLPILISKYREYKFDRAFHKENVIDMIFSELENEDNGEDNREEDVTFQYPLIDYQLILLEEQENEEIEKEERMILKQNDIFVFDKTSLSNTLAEIENIEIKRRNRLSDKSLSLEEISIE